ncbi:glycosyltransferase family 2 protein [Cruoricaptor ignavus]|uniref:glycosyltransferase family 2 protein n=1 Tax=Cruoricaptor ignavus TaxID=1118202 RepID=UPI00370D05C6
MKKPLLSLLIANYNNGKFFQDCYESLLRQTEQHWEAIILDDCSTDNSLEIIKEIIGDDSRCKVFENEKNEGVGYTKRRLVELATSEICGFLDPDDALVGNAIEKMNSAHSEHPEAGLIYSNFIICDENLNPKSTYKCSPVKNDDINFYNFGGKISHFATFKKSVYQKTSGINPFFRRAVDQDLYLKLYDAAPVHYIDEDLYLYRIHTGGVSTFGNGEKAFYWHTLAVLHAAERRGNNIEAVFSENYVRKNLYDREKADWERKLGLLKKSRWLKLGNRLGFVKFYDRL